MELATNVNAKLVRMWPWLLGVILVIFGSWFGYRQYSIQAETQLLAGDWSLIGSSGNPISKQGTPVVITIDDAEIQIDPLAEPRKIDFKHSNGEISKAIYRWENGALRVLQSSPGLERPRSFTDTIKDLQFEGRHDTFSLNDFRLVRPTN